MHPPMTEDESRHCGEARGDEAQAPHAHIESPSLPSAQPMPPSAPPNVSTPAYNDMKMPVPGVKPSEPRMVAMSFLEDVDPVWLNLVYLEKIVASALREGHAKGLKEGQMAGFCEGFEAGKRIGAMKGREQGFQEEKAAGLKEGHEEDSIE
ncbi:hypothetical protein EWM64_g5950, partial [Hericium alpestre]